MVKVQDANAQKKGEKSSKMGDTSKKMVVLLSMILIGILLIVYKSNYEYWSDQFIMYNQILFGVSILLLFLIIIIVILDFKRIMIHELVGFIIFLIGALIILMVPANNVIGMGSFKENSTMMFAIGAIIIVIGTVFLMRTGGFISICFFSVIINTLVAAYYAFGNTSAIQYNSNTLLMIDLSIIFFIISFILLLYNDIKYFYLAKLIKEEREFRKKNQYKQALNQCNKALRVYPYFATAWNNKGNVLINMGKKNDAINCYKKALIYNPEYLPAKRNLQVVQKA